MQKIALCQRLYWLKILIILNYAQPMNTQNIQTLHTAALGFEAARQINTLLPPQHRSRRLHGHSFLAHVRCTIPEQWAGFPGGEVTQLKNTLESHLHALDYQFLNEKIPNPTDENLARWLADRWANAGLGVGVGLAQVGLQSTAHQGATLDSQGHAHLWRRYIFQSAHRLPNVPIGHKCGRMHGHGFEVVLHANAQGICHDDLDKLWAPLHFELNYGCLNDIKGLENPTSEMMSSWIWNRLKPQLPQLSWVTVYETASCGAHYNGQHYRIWKELTLDSAVQLRHAPDGSPLRRIHGHTYTLRLHLCAPLDQVMGWTVDFGDVKEVFNPLFKALDHRPLYEIPDLVDGDTASLARWILEKAQPQLPALDRVDLYETQGCGAIVSMGEMGPAMVV